jgi:hypothetical protein
MRAARLVTWLLPLVLCGCQPQPAERAGTEPAAAPGAPAWPGYDYTVPAAPGQRAYRLDPAGSRLDIVVRREGPLARFGHDHVVSARGLEGFLLLDGAGTESEAILRFRLEDLDIDPADGRARYGLDTEPDTEAIEGTRDNLMEHVLDASQWPWATIRLDDFSSRQEHYSARVAIDISGKQNVSRQPFQLVASDSAAIGEGSLVIRQTDLGLEPFSALGGGLRVADPLEVHFRLEGTRLTGQPARADR